MKLGTIVSGLLSLALLLGLGGMPASASPAESVEWLATDGWKLVYENDISPGSSFYWSYKNGDWNISYTLKISIYKLKEVNPRVNRDYYLIRAIPKSEVHNYHKGYHKDWLGYLADVGPFTHKKALKITLVGEAGTPRAVELSDFGPQGTIGHRTDETSLSGGVSAGLQDVGGHFDVGVSSSVGHDDLTIVAKSSSAENWVYWEERFDGVDYGWYPKEDWMRFPPRIAQGSYAHTFWVLATVTNESDRSSPPWSLQIKVEPKVTFRFDDGIGVEGIYVVWTTWYTDFFYDDPGYVTIAAPTDNFPPEIQDDLLVTPSEVSEGNEVMFTGKAIDYDGTTPKLSWEVTVNDKVKASGTGTEFKYTPSYDICDLDNANRNAVVTLRASNGVHEPVKRVFELTVRNVNCSPEITSYNPRERQRSVRAGGSLDFSVVASDPDGDDLTYSWTIDGTEKSTSDTYTYRPTADEKGQEPFVKVIVSDGDKTVFRSWTITVAENSAPSITSFFPTDTGPEVDEAKNLTFSITASDPDNDPVTYDWWVVDKLVLQGKTAYTYKPSYDDAGIHKIKAVVSDGEDETIQEWTVTVNNVNRSPKIDSYKPAELAPEVDEGSPLSFEITASDPDREDVLSYGWRLDGKIVEGESTYYTYKPDYEAAGSHKVEATVSDFSVYVTQSWEVEVNNVNRAPEVRLLRPDGGESWSGIHNIEWEASDPDGDPVTIDILYSPDGGENWRVASKGEPNDGVYSWDTTNHPDGTDYRIKIVASDADLTGEDKSQYNFTIDNSPPSWQGTGLEAAVAVPSAGGVDVILYWNAADDITPPVKYNVYYDTTSPLDFDSKEKIADVPAQSGGTHDCQYTVTGLSPGQTYYFAVRAEDSADLPHEDENRVTLVVYSTPNTSADWDMNKLVLNSRGVVTKESPDMSSQTYVFNGSVTVMQSDSLTAYPGTNLIFAADGGRCLSVYGRLSASDTVFTSNKKTRGDWFGLVLGRGSQGLFDKCTIEYARRGISCYYSKLDMKNSIIRQNSEEGIFFIAPVFPLIIEDTVISRNGRYGILGSGCPGGSIAGNTIEFNNADGISVSHESGTTGEAIPGALGIVKNTIQQNLLNGISCRRCGIEVLISENIITGNGEAGVSMQQEGIVGPGPIIIDNKISKNRNGIYSQSCSPIVRGNAITENTHGIVCKGALVPDIGTHDPITHPNEPAGYNEIRGNIGYEIYAHLTAGKVFAQDNWWGTPIPTPSQFFGNVEYLPCLPKPPIGPMPSDITPPAPPTGLEAVVGFGELKLSWNASAGLDGGGYRVRYGAESRHYDGAIDVGDLTSYSLRGLEGGKTYFIAISAYDSTGNKSNYSEEVSETPYRRLDEIFLDFLYSIKDYVYRIFRS